MSFEHMVMIVEHISDFLYMLMSAMLFKKFFTPKFHIVIILIIANSYIFFCFPTFSKAFIDKVPTFLPMIILFYLPFMLFFRGKLISKMLLMSLMSANSILLELFLAFLLTLVFKMQSSLTMFFIARLFGISYYYLIYRISSLFFPAIKVFTLKMQAAFLCYFLGQYLIYNSLELHLLQYPLQNTYNISILVNTLLLILSIVMLTILHHSTKLKRKIKKLELENKLLEEMCQAVKKEEEKIIRLRHDIGNHLLAIDVLLKNNDAKHAKQYYNEVRAAYQTHTHSKGR